MIVLEVIIPIPFNKTFYYLPLENIEPKNFVGKRVKVPFANRVLVGYVIALKDIDLNSISELNFKAVVEVLDNKPLITQETIELSNYISNNYVCSFGEALASVVPISMKASKRAFKVKVSKDCNAQERHILNSWQTNALFLINSSLEKSVNSCFLVHGITASGKTEVYIKAIEKALAVGKSAIMLIPEISLTSQFVNIMTQRFGENLGVWHSNISNIVKYQLFLKAQNGEIKVMLGARSAVFAPFKNLGLIIVDEEHEHTYKQDQKPSYDAREIAKWRAKYNNGVVVFGSATPSLETYKDALEKKITLIEMKERVGKKSLPEIKVVPLNNRPRSSLFIPETVEAISNTIAKKEQTMIFLNRRGYSPTLMCRQCGSVYQCPRCSISMVFHRNPDTLKCHYCGATKNLPIICPACASRQITVFGTGTQKVEDELRKLFPNAKTFRLDGDTATSKKSYDKAYNGIRNLEFDILIGTQMIAKGFNFPQVSLVCVVDADTSLYLPGFKSVEKTFQLITQVSGRSGRGDVKGSVIVQTNHSSHYAIEYAKNNDYISFYNTEIEQRRKLNYPPYCDIAKITIKNKNEKKTSVDSQKLFYLFKDLNEKYGLNLILLGPVPAYIAKLNNLFRKYIIIKGKRDNILKLTKFTENIKQSSGTSIITEIMPSELI
ncbi:MAG: primosomal protein N' [Endomicrobium sp.]|jgi:primosomal protein N' (replication factor Y)|nr:primosomal protein N' [Endomicrobium sp.]